MSQSLGPMEIYDGIATEMDPLRGAYFDAIDEQRDLETQLAAAKRVTGSTRNRLVEFCSSVLQSIHDSVDETTEPADYLQAVLSLNGGAEAGRLVVEQQVSPFRERVREASIPIGIISSGSAIFGMSAGDLNVRKRLTEHPYTESGIDTRQDIVPEIPVIGASHISDRVWLLRPRSVIEELPYALRKPYLFRTYQDLFRLRFAGDADSVRAAFDAEAPEFSSRIGADNSYHQTKKRLGTLPVVAYGVDAVTELIIALSEGRNTERVERVPEINDFLALAVSLGISPGNIQDVNEESLKQSMQEQIAAELTQQGRRLIWDASRRREDPNLYFNFVNWGIILNSKVVDYSGIEQTRIQNALVTGVESVVEKLRNDHPDDQHTFISLGNEREHRLLLSEAQSLLVDVISARYGLNIDPSTLNSREITRLMEEQQAAKSAKKRRHEELEERTIKY